MKTFAEKITRNERREIFKVADEININMLHYNIAPKDKKKVNKNMIIEYLYLHRDEIYEIRNFIIFYRNGFYPWESLYFDETFRKNVLEEYYENASKRKVFYLVFGSGVELKEIDDIINYNQENYYDIEYISKEFEKLGRSKSNLVNFLISCYKKGINFEQVKWLIENKVFYLAGYDLFFIKKLINMEYLPEDISQLKKCNQPILDKLIYKFTRDELLGLLSFIPAKIILFYANKDFNANEIEYAYNSNKGLSANDLKIIFLYNVKDKKEFFNRYC